MTDSDDATGPVGLNKTRVAAAALTTGGVLAGLITVGWALARYVNLSTQPSSVTDFLATTALMFAGVGLGLLLHGVAEVLRTLDRLSEARSQAGPLSSDATLYGVQVQPETPVKGMGDVSAALRVLVALTREVRDISMLSESDRAARVKAQGEALVRELTSAIPALLQEHNWVEARRRVQQARERFPGFTEWDGLAEQIEALRAGVEARDMESTTRQVNDLIALGAWQRVAAALQELLERHPDSEKAQQLARRVAIQRDKADAEQRARLMAQAQEAVNRREYNQALGLANDVIRRFPKSAEAEALRQQLPTLVENAEIQTRHQMESEIRDLLKQQRYSEAVRLAHELIERYPNSPQAGILREQLPRLEHKAALTQ